MIASSILDTIGDTPHVRINRLFDPRVQVWMKLERANPGGSIKDRIALAMIEDAEARGVLAPGGTIIEPTSGNTGIGLALVAAVKGYRVVLVMPESMSIERRRLMAAYGAELRAHAPRGRDAAGRSSGRRRSWTRRPAGGCRSSSRTRPTSAVHEQTTTRGDPGRLPGRARRAHHGRGHGRPHHRLRACAQGGLAVPEGVSRSNPQKSPVISGGAPGPHNLQGIGAGFVPANLDRAVLDGVVQVSEEEAFEYAARAAREEGIFVGISSGASLAAVAQTLPDLPDGARVLTFCYDTGERYLSIEGLF